MGLLRGQPSPEFGERRVVRATNPAWQMWKPSDPTSAHWYKPEHFERLIAAYIVHDQDNGRVRTVRELITEFRGLSGTAKQKAVLNANGLSREPLTAPVWVFLAFTFQYFFTQ